MKKKTLIICVYTTFILLPISSIASTTLDDLDPLVDLELSISIQTIRGLEDSFADYNGFSMDLTIQDSTFTSTTWTTLPYATNINWTVTYDIPDDQEEIPIVIELYALIDDTTILCDLSDNSVTNSDKSNRTITLSYQVKTNRWTGDDVLGDSSGYGRLNGCDDGTIYEEDNDCELWFTISQTDPDGDMIPYWMEENILFTDPLEDDSQTDFDNDEIPTWWEYKWGYDPLTKDDHDLLDEDNDSITNIEEYITSSFGSDPYRKDIFLEFDYMQEGPNGEQNIVPPGAFELLKNPVHRRNIVYHFDTGEINGGEFIPYQETISFDEIMDVYTQYFLHENNDTWRRSVFHYGLIVHESFPKGYGFSGDVSPYWGYLPGTNSFVISSTLMEKNARLTSKTLEYLYASAIMHEMGHNFGLRNGHPPGCDMRSSKYPWQIGWWLFRTYKSIMNYHYTYRIFDYSDGTHGTRDFDDWSALDFSHFEIPE
jgi:hypothetical protein